MKNNPNNPFYREFFRDSNKDKYLFEIVNLERTVLFCKKFPLHQICDIGCRLDIINDIIIWGDWESHFSIDARLIAQKLVNNAKKWQEMNVFW